jgi:excisionase family DNA binding protein
MTQIPDKPYFTASEVARLLLVSANSVRVWTNKGLLKTELTLGGHRRFPRREIERLVKERQARSQVVKPEAFRVLIIDDDELLCEILQEGIKNAVPQAQVSVATDGFSGGMLARSTNPEIILLDLLMPGLDGFQVCRMLKADEVTRRIRIIAISGSRNEADGVLICEAGAEVLLAKPLEIPTLIEIIRTPPKGRNQLLAKRRVSGKSPLSRSPL